MNDVEKMDLKRLELKKEIEKMKKERWLNTFIWWSSPYACGINGVCGPFQILNYIGFLVSLGFLLFGNLTMDFKMCALLANLFNSVFLCSIGIFGYKTYYNLDKLEEKEAELRYVENCMVDLKMKHELKKTETKEESPVKGSLLEENNSKTLKEQICDLEELKAKAEKLNLVLLRRLLEKTKEESISYAYESLMEELGDEYKPTIDKLLLEAKNDDKKLIKK